MNAGLEEMNFGPGRVGTCDCAASSGLRKRYAVGEELKKHSHTVEEESAKGGEIVRKMDWPLK